MFGILYILVLFLGVIVYVNSSMLDAHAKKII
jgi:hypothetical protein